MSTARPLLRLPRRSSRVRALAIGFAAWHLLVATWSAFFLVDWLAPRARLVAGREVAAAHRDCCCASEAQCRSCCCATETRRPAEAPERTLSDLACTGRTPDGALVLPSLDPIAIPVADAEVASRASSPAPAWSRLLVRPLLLTEPDKVPI